MDRYYYGDGGNSIFEPEYCQACGRAWWSDSFDAFCSSIDRGFCEAHYILSEYLIGWEDLS